MQVLKGHRASHVHVHHIERGIGRDEAPSHDALPVAFLEAPASLTGTS
jgi:hypothetical protein